MSYENASQNPASKALSFAWELLVTPTAFVVLAILWCLDLGIGSLIAYRNDPKFWMKMDSVPFNYWLKEMAPAEWPTSLWVYILVALTYLMVLSLLFCTLNWFLKKRRRYRGMAEVLVHLGFLLVFAGYVLGSGWGARVQNIPLEAGQETEVAEMGLRLKAESVEIMRDAGGNDLDTVSFVKLYDSSGSLVKEGEIGINRPLIAGSTVVYPNSNAAGSAVTVTVSGLGTYKLSGDGRANLPDGRQIGIRGFLPPGGRWGNKFGPGVFLTISDSKGAGLFTGFLGYSPETRRTNFGRTELTLDAVEETTVALFHVHRDPGIQFVLIGALILTLGTFWALYGYLTRSGIND